MRIEAAHLRVALFRKVDRTFREGGITLKKPLIFDNNGRMA